MHVSPGDSPSYRTAPSNPSPPQTFTVWVLLSSSSKSAKRLYAFAEICLRVFSGSAAVSRRRYTFCIWRQFRGLSAKDQKGGTFCLQYSSGSHGRWLKDSEPELCPGNEHWSGTSQSLTRRTKSLKNSAFTKLH